MIGDQPGYLIHHVWYGPIYSLPADAASPYTGSGLTSLECTGMPTSSFKVENGLVTHC
jgi:hypothetical protein